MRKKMMKIKISLLRSVEKLKSRKRYFCLFVCFGVFISEIKLPRIPPYLLNLFFQNGFLLMFCIFSTPALPAAASCSRRAERQEEIARASVRI